MSIIVIRLHPDKPTTGQDFTAYLEGLEITVVDRSFANPKGINPDPQHVLGAAATKDGTIVQHLAGVFPSQTGTTAATAAIEVPDPLSYPEYLAPDLRLTVTRTPPSPQPPPQPPPPPPPPEKILVHDMFFNVALAPGSKPAPDPLRYAALNPVALYLPLPPPQGGLGPDVAYLEVPTDGTPVPYDDVLGAVNKVLAKDPDATPPDLTTLSPEQCLHLAREIVSDPKFDPLPEPSKTLEEMYTAPGNKDARRQFESDLLTYYTVRGTRATTLANFIYSVSAALACNQTTKVATTVGFTFPILPGLTPPSGRVAETTVGVSE